jgi:hypothetical protein
MKLVGFIDEGVLETETKLLNTSHPALSVVRPEPALELGWWLHS